MLTTNIDFLHQYNLGEGVVAFSTKRHGAGVSSGSYGEMNINPFCGDCLENVSANLDILANTLQIDKDNIVLPHQVHKTEVRNIDEDYLLLPSIEREAYLDGIDAVVTNLRGICIGVSTADCVPVLLYDPNKKVVAAAHAGWRGTVAKIVEKTLLQMQTVYGCYPQDIRAQIGPSISLESFEVGGEVYEEFQHNGFPMSSIAKRINNKWHIDLWQANKLLLTDCSVTEGNIQIANICTYINHDQFFSARRLTINSGRIYTGIMMKRKEI